MKTLIIDIILLAACALLFTGAYQNGSAFWMTICVAGAIWTIFGMIETIRKMRAKRKKDFGISIKASTDEAVKVTQELSKAVRTWNRN